MERVFTSSSSALLLSSGRCMEPEKREDVVVCLPVKRTWNRLTDLCPPPDNRTAGEELTKLLPTLLDWLTCCQMARCCMYLYRHGDSGGSFGGLGKKNKSEDEEMKKTGNTEKHSENQIPLLRHYSAASKSHNPTPGKQTLPGS